MVGTAEGAQAEWVRIQAQGTTTAGMIRLFFYDGTTWQLWDEIPVSAVTPSGTTPAFEAEYFFSRPITLYSGKKLGIATNNAETFDCYGLGGNF